MCHNPNAFALSLHVCLSILLAHLTGLCRPMIARWGNAEVAGIGGALHLFCFWLIHLGHMRRWRVSEEHFVVFFQLTHHLFFLLV